MEHVPMKTKATPALAECRWFWRDETRHEWVQDGEPIDCRASIGAKVVTVWLPGGAVIRQHRPRFAATLYEGNYDHRYGRFDDKLIRYTLKPANP
jgi:hypothetical protein